MGGAQSLLWTAAGSPERPETVDVPPGVRCWWCASDAGPRGCVVDDVVSDTFPDARDAAAALDRHPRADGPKGRIRQVAYLCGACSWCWCERISLPASTSAAKIRARCERGARLNVKINGESAAVLALALQDGSVGLWGKGANAAAEEPWMKAAASLRTDPRDVGACRFLRSVPAESIEADASEKFRSYHHAAVNGAWSVYTDSDKASLRVLILEPPPSPWCLVIGDGQKHRAIYGEVSPGGRGWQVVHFDGRNVHYLPADLARSLRAVEQLFRAGADESDITAGRCPRSRSASGLPLIRAAWPVVEPMVGSAALDLCLYLRRRREEILADGDLVKTDPTGLPTIGAVSVGHPALSDPTPADAGPTEPAATHADPGGDPPRHDDSRDVPGIGGQLSLFGGGGDSVRVGRVRRSRGA